MNLKPQFDQFITDASLVRRFEKSRPQCSVNLDGRTNDLSGNLVDSGRRNEPMPKCHRRTRVSHETTLVRTDVVKSVTDVTRERRQPVERPDILCIFSAGVLRVLCD